MRAKAVSATVSFGDDKGNMFTDSGAKAAAGERIAKMEVALQRGRGKALVGGQLEIIVPMSNQLAQVHVLELCS